MAGEDHSTAEAVAVPDAVSGATPEIVAPAHTTQPSAGVSTALASEAAEDEEAGYDSAIGDLESTGSVATGSVTSSIKRYREENGRTYHAYKEGNYVMPNDDPEKDRLDLSHHMFLLSFDGALGLCPVHEKGARIGRVLDVGTGTGIWAIDMGDEHPEAEIIGIDLSPIQPHFVPPNVKFEIDDLEEDWTFNRKFDYIHARALTGTFANWPRFIQQSYENLNPGGWLEIPNFCMPALSDDGTLKPEHNLYKWCNLVLDCSIKFGRRGDICPEIEGYMKDAGFINTKVIVKKWPSNTWPENDKDKELGLWNMENLTGGTGPGIEAICIALLTRVAGWTQEEVEVFCAKVKADVRNKEIHSYWPLWIVYGQKSQSV